MDCVTVWYTGCSAADTKDYPQGNKHSTKTTGTGDTPPKSFKKTLRIVPTLDACCVTCCPVVDTTRLSRQGQFFIQVQSLLKITFITVHHCTFYLIFDWISIVIYYIPLEKACLAAQITLFYCVNGTFLSNLSSTSMSQCLIMQWSRSSSAQLKL